MEKVLIKEWQYREDLKKVVEDSMKKYILWVHSFKDSDYEDHTTWFLNEFLQDNYEDWEEPKPTDEPYDKNVQLPPSSDNDKPVTEFPYELLKETRLKDLEVYFYESFNMPNDMANLKDIWNWILSHAKELGELV